MVFLCDACACVFDLRNFNVNALGPTPTDVTVSSSGCRSLRVTWTHHAPTPPLTLNHYRVRYWPQSRSLRSATTSSEGSYTITRLAPATTYTVVVDAQTQLGYGSFCCTPTVAATTHNGEASSDAYRGYSLLKTACYIAYVSHVTELVYSMHVMHLFCIHTSEVHYHLTQCYYIDLSAADLAMYECQRECNYSLIAMFVTYSA